MWLEDLPREALVAPPVMAVPDDVDLPLDYEEEEEEPDPKKPAGKAKAPPAKPKAGVNQKP
jgi:hypothetical protein